MNKLYGNIYKEGDVSRQIHASMTLNEWYAVWIQYYKVGYVKPSTLQNYSSIYHNQIKKRIGSLPLQSIQPLHIHHVYRDLEYAHLSAKYQHCVHAILSNMLETASQNDLISKNPCHRMKISSLPPKQEHILSIEEHTALLHTLLQPEHQSIAPPLLTLLGTGLRVGELLALTWENVDLNTRHIYIEKTLVYLWDPSKNSYAFSFQTPKTSSGRRVVPISPSVAKALESQKCYIAHLKQDTQKWHPLLEFENLVFPNSHGRPQQRRDIQRSLDRVVAALNEQRLQASHPLPAIPHIHPHTLRHSFATRCFEAEIQPKIVQTLLGHSSIQITMDLYTHVSLEACQKSMQKLEQFGI